MNFKNVDYHFENKNQQHHILFILEIESIRKNKTSKNTLFDLAKNLKIKKKSDYKKIHFPFIISIKINKHKFHILENVSKPLYNTTFKNQKLQNMESMCNS